MSNLRSTCRRSAPGEKPLKPVDGNLVSNGKVTEHEANLGQAQLGPAQQAHELSGTDLGDAVASVPVGFVDLHWGAGNGAVTSRRVDRTSTSIVQAGQVSLRR